MKASKFIKVLKEEYSDSVNLMASDVKIVLYMNDRKVGGIDVTRQSIDIDANGNLEIAILLDLKGV